MDAQREYQVVEVVDECRLRDCRGIEHPYWRRDGRALQAGVYVVHWPSGAMPGRFNEDSLFDGPFRSRSGAEADMLRIRALYAGDPLAEACRRSPEDPVAVVDDRVPPRFRRST